MLQVSQVSSTCVSLSYKMFFDDPAQHVHAMVFRTQETVQKCTTLIEHTPPM